MSLRTFIRLTLALMLIDAIVLGLLYSIQRATAFTPALLAARAVVDILFIVTNAERIGLKRHDGLMIFWLIGAGLIGVILALSGASAYSLPRAGKDVVLPILFILKVALIIRLLPQQTSLAAEIQMLVRWLVIGSMLQIAIFMTIGRLFGAYIGISVPATLPMANALARNGLALGLVMFVLILASGKRAILVSVFAALAVLISGARRRFMAILAISVAALFFAALAPLFEDTIKKFEATFAAAKDIGDVIERGPGAILDEDVRIGFYLATAGRSEEFYGLVTKMKPLNYLLGLGAGFTYDYAHTDGIVKGYSNSHFSPLSLTYKFGLVFCVVFYFYMFRRMFRLIRCDMPIPRLVGFALLMLAVQSLFSFNLFAEPLLPILSAIAAFLCGERYGPASATFMEANSQPAVGGVVSAT